MNTPQQNYNFASSSLSSFVSIVTDKSFTLLLPDPIQREIDRHIKERADGVSRTLDDAKRKAPFLSKWEAWPLKNREGKPLLSWELYNIAIKEWNAFLELFNVQKLAYDDVKIQEIMNWYEQGRGPFGKGKKRKEFPDAFAISAILGFAKKHNASIAVISCDGDIQKACDTHAQLLYFKSLPAFTEAILSSDKMLKTAKDLIKSDEDSICNAISDVFCNFNFYLDSEMDGEIDEVTVNHIELEDLSVIGIGELECIVSFEAYIDFKAGFEYYDPYGRYHSEKVSTDQGEFVAGAMKTIFNEKWDKVKEIHILEVEDPVITIKWYPY